ncbi:HlyD family secretion protein [Lysinibacillus sp. NPDC096418]|uniref:HlyD family secretion protein n=1 Tax=Lysinibacillus sp. NPDC096418 TaxID=3364138 RepID=UPI003808939C
MNFLKARPWTSITVVAVAILIGLNAYFVFKDDSKVARSYFIDEFQKAYTRDNVERINKETIVAPAETYTITTDATSLSAISVKRGQEVATTDLLATYKTEEVDDELTKLEAEQAAYETELSDLESALSQIETDATDPTSSINTDQISDKLAVTVEMELAGQNSTSTAIAILNRHIAETTRQIALIDAQIAQLQARQGVISPVDGVIANITEEAGSVTFEIYSSEKGMLAYLSEDEWQQVMAGQTVDFELQHFEDDLTGVVIEKQMIATNNDSFWANQLAKSVKLPHPSNYEVTLQQDAILEEIPFSTVGKASIIVNEAADSFKVDKNWVKSSKKDTHSLYIVGQDGKIRLEDIQVEFETANSTIFTGYLDEGTPMLSNEKRNIMARSFRTMPIEKIQWQHFKELGWKEYIKYITF